METNIDEKTLRVLKLLARSYPSGQAVFTEIINLRAIMNLPKGTEHYISDIHGEYVLLIILNLMLLEMLYMRS